MLSEVIARTQRLRLIYCSCVGFGRRSFLAYGSEPKAMKLFATIIALSLAGAIVTPAIAAEYPMTKADCEKAGLKWKEEKHKCKPSVRVVNWSPAKRLWAWIGLGSAVVGLIVLYRDWRTPRDSSGRS